MSRPEYRGPAKIVYNEEEAQKYTYNSRIAAVQAEMSFRAIELLNLPKDQCCFILDIGCGSGLSGEILEEEGHHWVGVDISPAMLAVAKEREVEGDLFLQDAGEGLGFRPGTFDGAISISMLQWLCNSDQSSHNPYKRLTRFFNALLSVLKNGSRAVFQIYPANDDQLDLITKISMKCGFTGGLVIDYPNSKKARKFYLCLFVGQANAQLPKGISSPVGEVGENQIKSANGKNKDKIRDSIKKISKNKSKFGNNKEWILHKKELARQRGKPNIPRDSKYTGRKRKTRF